MPNDHKQKFIIVGAGLGGALLATRLGQMGYPVDVYEIRGDLRDLENAGGRSINLALSYRGICALEQAGLSECVLKAAVPMPGRMIHSRAGELTFQPYGNHAGQAINSVSRAGLNCILLDAAEACDNVRLTFNRKCSGVDLESGEVTFVDTVTHESSTADGAIIVGADGAFSAVRSSMQRLDRFNYRQDYLEHGYKELVIPPGPDGAFRIEKNALHIWPRRSFMMIALPNIDASFTVTLFWPHEGPNSFDSIKTEAEIVGLFKREFPDAIEHMPTLVEDYLRNPASSLATVRCAPWYWRDKVVLLGDAAHAVVPFYGQGMNASFEDVLVLTECIERDAPDWRRCFEQYHRERKDNVDTLADLAIGNFIEMRDHTGKRLFLLKKKKEKLLHRLLGSWYVPLYSMATFTRMPYVEAVTRAKRQDRVVAGCALVLAGLLIMLVLALFR